MRSRLSVAGLIMIAGAFVLASFAAATPAAADPQTLEYSTKTPAEFSQISHPARVCCKRGRHDWWTTPRACWRAGGHHVSARHCRNDWNEVRVCCKRGRYDWWTTPRACARSGGYRVSGWQCRNG
jgi:hypothetical protein